PLCHPPYRHEDIEEALAGIVNESVLKAGGIVVVECGAKRDLPDDQAGLKMVRQEKYGDTMLAFFRTL
ncbi:MAG: RsmD family RNA methyltransferase, partial [Firmicutes bacterium]|nr:RsmD family RNA methyltransferase [Bacillota bacterium]